MIQADEQLLGRARRRAAERGVSVAQVFREALERDLGTEPVPPDLTTLGMVDSPTGDLSRRASSGEYEAEPYR